MTFQEANALSFEQVWPALVGEEAPKPGKKCRAPYREDPKPGCWRSSFNGREYFNDRSVSRQSIGVVNFTALMLAFDQDSKEGAVAALQWLGERFGIGHTHTYRQPKPKPRFHYNPPRKKEWISYDGELRNPTENELVQITQTRGKEVSMDGLRLMVSRGLLHVGEAYGQQCYVITDKTRRSVDFRRLDGELFSSGSKTMSAKGISHDWPVGVQEMVDGNFQDVMLVEGSGDPMSAHKLVYAEGRNLDRPSYPKVCVVSVLGAHNGIPADCLQNFAGRRIWIYPDNDNAGRKAGRVWEAQLGLVVREVQQFSLEGFSHRDGKPVNDLGELAGIPAHQISGQAGLVCPH